MHSLLFICSHYKLRNTFCNFHNVESEIKHSIQVATVRLDKKSNSKCLMHLSMVILLKGWGIKALNATDRYDNRLNLLTVGFLTTYIKHDTNTYSIDLYTC